MVSVLNEFSRYPEETVAAGEVILSIGETSDRLFVLIDGAMEVFRDDISIAIVSEPGAIFGELSVLLGIPHTASVRAIKDSSVCVIGDATAFLAANPSLALPIAKLLAERLQHATTYLVDLKRQFSDEPDHFNMLDEVLEALLNAQRRPFSDPPASPHEQ